MAVHKVKCFLGLCKGEGVGNSAGQVQFALIDQFDVLAEHLVLKPGASDIQFLGGDYELVDFGGAGGEAHGHDAARVAGCLKKVNQGILVAHSVDGYGCPVSVCIFLYLFKQVFF